MMAKVNALRDDPTAVGTSPCKGRQEGGASMPNILDNAFMHEL